MAQKRRAGKLSTEAPRGLCLAAHWMDVDYATDPVPPLTAGQAQWAGLILSAPPKRGE